MGVYNYKKGLLAMLGCFLIWGFQPLYWYLCEGMDTFFLLACRIIFAGVCCVLLLKMQGKLSQLKAAFCDKAVMKREIPTAVLLFLDWAIYLWAVQNGRVLECSLGYYIQPLVVFTFGAVIFKEKISWRHFIIIAIVIVGIVLSTNGFGGVPYVTISLAVLFAIYAAIKKSLTIDSIVSTTMEILMMVPFAILYILIFRMGDNGVASVDFVRFLLIVGSGIVTAAPMLFYAVGVRNLPMMTAGICQYLSPTIGIFCSMIMGEMLTSDKLVSFYFIWAGVILYVLNMFYEEHKKKKQTA